ncbi:hypothetical protein ACFX2I_038479 [Malus domestica]
MEVWKRKLSGSQPPQDRNLVDLVDLGTWVAGTGRASSSISRHHRQQLPGSPCDWVADALQLHLSSNSLASDNWLSSNHWMSVSRLSTRSSSCRPAACSNLLVLNGVWVVGLLGWRRRGSE